VFDFALPVSLDILSLAWHDRLQTTASVDPAVRDRDLKLLAWLEYAENLVEILKTQQAMRVTPSSAEAPSPRPREGRAGSTRPGSSQRIIEEGTEGPGGLVVDIGRRWAGKWDNWASAWSVRADP
jgi:hypothetical protein